MAKVAKVLIKSTWKLTNVFVYIIVLRLLMTNNLLLLLLILKTTYATPKVTVFFLILGIGLTECGKEILLKLTHIIPSSSINYAFRTFILNTVPFFHSSSYILWVRSALLLALLLHILYFHD